MATTTSTKLQPSASTAKAPGSVESVYSIKVPKNISKRYHVMRFNKNLGIEFSKWSQVKMERENNMKEFKGTTEEEMPKFGAGSEFGREAKEEARRKKLGIISRKYKADDQPWILKSYGSSVKKFKGIREGGVAENASYYVFTQCANGAIEAFPLHEWYKFQPIQRYKALTAEEAEQEFNKRNKHLNFFSLMLRKRLKGDEETEIEEGEEGKSKKTTKKTKDLTISEMDEWMDSSDGDSSDDEEKKEDEEDEDKKEKKKKAKKNEVKKKKKKNRDTDGEAFEDSDDGDDEGRELDYISDSSDSEPEETKLEGVAEEKALRKLLTSDEDSDDSDKSDKEEKKEDEENKEKDPENKEESPDKDKKKAKKKSKKKDNKKDTKKDDNSDFSSDSSTDEDVKKQKAAKKAKKEESKDVKDGNSANSSRAGTPVDTKRKLSDLTTNPGPSNKKPKLDVPLSNYIPGSVESGITEDAVRKYLMRKPMTTTELLQKFKAKKTGLSSDQLVNIMTQILKKINPVKQMLKGKMYLSIKS